MQHLSSPFTQFTEPLGLETVTETDVTDNLPDHINLSYEAAVNYTTLTYFKDLLCFKISRCLSDL